MLANFVRWFDRDGLRWVAAKLVFLIYFIKGERIRHVGFNSNFRLWEYQIGNSFFISNQPSWFSSDAYAIQTFERYSGFQYMPNIGDTVVDVGAGVGEEIAALANLVGQNGKVFAIEANPKTFSVLKYFCNQNEFHNTHLFNVAIAATKGQLLIEDDGAYGVQNAIIDQPAKSGFVVQAQSLDEFLEGNLVDTVDFLKVNIEGAERFLVQGMTRSMSKIKRIAISCHDFRFLAGESDFFKTKQFVVECLTPYFDLTFQQSGDPVKDHYVYGVNKLFQPKRE